MKKIISKISPFMLSAIAMCSLVLTPNFVKTSAEEETSSKVKVGYYIQDRFQMKDETTGQRSGYAYEYLQKVAQYGGFEYQYIEGTYEALTEKVLNNEIDVMMYCFGKEETLIEPLNIGMYPAMLEDYYLYKRTSDSSIDAFAIENYIYDSLEGKTIGLLQDTADRFFAESWIDSMKWFVGEGESVPNITLVDYEDKAKLESDFFNSKVDMMIDQITFAKEYKTATSVVNIGSYTYYLSTGVAEDGYSPINEEIYDMVLDAINKLDVIEPSYKDYLKNKYYGDTNTYLDLASDEAEYVENHKNLKIGYLDSFLPFSGTDKENNVTGIVKDVIPQIGAELNLNISYTASYKKYGQYKAMQDALESGEVDVIFPFIGSVWDAEQEKLSVTNSIMTSSSSIVVKGTFDKNKIKKLAVNKENLLTLIITKDNFPAAETVEYASTKQCLDAVLSGKVDGVILNSLRASEMLKSSHYQKLSGIPLLTGSEVRFAVKKNNPALLSVLNRGISVIDGDFASAKAYDYLGELYRYTSREFIASNLPLILGITASFLLVLVVVILVSVSLKNKATRKYQKELEEARQNADDANLAKTTFLFNMSHDIRTPMNAILGYTDIGLRHVDDIERSKDSYRKIKAAGGHLLNLINDILEMSRIESGKVELSNNPIDIRDGIETVTHMSRALASPKSIKFETVIENIKNPYIYADELHISEVIINLISNAIKYTNEDGEVTYRINQISDVVDNKVSFKFEISDNGIGMSEEFQKHLFEAFAREETSTVSKTEGAGLGLSIVKKIVDIAGGTIEVKSNLNKGSTFTVILPFSVMDEEAIEEYKKNKAALIGIEEDVSLEGKKILLVEDNELNREICSELLTEAGFVVESAENGEIAVNLLKDNGVKAFDFILMDIQMPVMNGYEATKVIRELPDGNDIPIIALSANAFKEDVDKSLSSGMNAHIAKPIDTTLLLDTLQKLAK